MDNKELQFIIANSPPFTKLKKRQLKDVLELCEIKEYQNAQTIYRQGDSPDYLYFLITGRVVASVDFDNQQKNIDTLKRGTCFGIISLLTNEVHSVTTRSIERSLIAQIPKDAFRAFLERNPLIALDFSRMLSKRVTSRSKPKTVFQSKKVALLRIALTEPFHCLQALSESITGQTQRRVIAIEMKSTAPEELASGERTLLLSEFNEDTLSNYIIPGQADRLRLVLNEKSKFFALLNFLSESYHFILYDLACGAVGECPKALIEAAHEIYFLVPDDPTQLQNIPAIRKGLGNFSQIDREKATFIIAESSRPQRLLQKKTKAALTDPIFTRIPVPGHASFPEVIQRLARSIGEVSIGLALGSGAAYGFAHIGVLKVLKEAGIDIDIICGSSTGALIAALWAAGYSIEESERIAHDFSRKMSACFLTGFSLPMKGFLRARRLENIFKSIFKKMKFSDLKHTLGIAAFDFLNRKTVILKKGFLYKALAASCAFPGIFEPIRFKKEILLDGGILTPLPTEVLLQYGAHKIIASNIMLSRDEALRGYAKRNKLHIFDFIFGSIESIQQLFINKALGAADVVIHPNLEGISWVEFDKVSELIARGEQAAYEKLDEIRKLVAL